jgi:hypothetical protein
MHEFIRRGAAPIDCGSTGASVVLCSVRVVGSLVLHMCLGVFVSARAAR